jgi:hypothetical protein
LTPEPTTQNVLTPVTNNDTQTKEAKIQQQSYKPIKIASAKPPPPSTKIPKSAVVMPDGSSGSAISLDVQFGIDLESHLPDINKEKHVEKVQPQVVQKQSQQSISNEFSFFF